MKRWTRVIAAASVLAASGSTAATAAAAPSASSPPSLGGKAVSGGKLACKNGSWSSGAGSFTYQWQLASGNVPIGSGTSLKLRAGWVGQAITCAVTAKDSSGTTTAYSPPVTVRPITPKIIVSTAKQTAPHTIKITGRVTPTKSLAGGAGSLVLYRQTRAGLQQLSFNGNQTRPARKSGAFTLVAATEPTGRFTYVIEYVPSAPGYATQVLAERKIRVRS